MNGAVDIRVEDFDIERLRDYLLQQCATPYFKLNAGLADPKVKEIMKLSDSDLLKKAKELNINLVDFLKKNDVNNIKR